MTASAWEKEAFLQKKLIEKYGAEYGITSELLDKIEQGTASPAELKTYTDSAEGLVMRFKSDMRKTEPDNYSDQDIEIIMAMIDANYRYFEQGKEKLSKIIDTNRIIGNLAQNSPMIGGFVALDRHSADLSPQQIISQFGLDYKKTPYLKNDGKKDIRQPFLFAINTPMNEEIKKNAKLPVDPRILLRFIKIAEESKDPEKKAKAKDFLDNYLKTDKMIPIFRSNKNEDLDPIKQYLTKPKAKNSDYYADLSRVDQFIQTKGKLTNEAPYTGNTAPQYGQKLENQSSYADIVQEMRMNKLSKVSTEAVLSVKFPKSGTGSSRERSERGDLPAGSNTVTIAEWNGEKWAISVKPDELKRKFTSVMESYTSDYPEIADQWTKDFDTFLEELRKKA